MMKPEQAEKSARLQAKLRGYSINPDGSVDTTGKPFFAPLDPFDPADMWELVKLAKMEVVTSPHRLGWWAFIDNRKSVKADGPLEAAQAAWFKLIEEHGDE